MTERVPSFIGGRLREPRAAEVHAIPDPATGQTIAEIPARLASLTA